MKTELIGNFCGIHCVWQILLIGKHQQQSVTQLILIQHTLQLIACVINTVAIVRIHDIDDPLGILKVVTPQRPNLVLTTYIPYSKANVFVLDSFDIKSNGRNSGNDFTQLELVKNGGFTGGIEANQSRPS